MTIAYRPKHIFLNSTNKTRASSKPKQLVPMPTGTHWRPIFHSSSFSSSSETGMWSHSTGWDLGRDVGRVLIQVSKSMWLRCVRVASALCMQATGWVMVIVREGGENVTPSGLQKDI